MAAQNVDVKKEEPLVEEEDFEAQFDKLLAQAAKQSGNVLDKKDLASDALKRQVATSTTETGKVQGAADTKKMTNQNVFDLMAKANTQAHEQALPQDPEARRRLLQQRARARGAQSRHVLPVVGVGMRHGVSQAASRAMRKRSDQRSEAAQTRAQKACAQSLAGPRVAVPAVSNEQATTTNATATTATTANATDIAAAPETSGATSTPTAAATATTTATTTAPAGKKAELPAGANRKERRQFEKQQKIREEMLKARAVKNMPAVPPINPALNEQEQKLQNLIAQTDVSTAQVMAHLKKQANGIPV